MFYIGELQLITKSSGDVRSNTKAPWGISTEMFVQAMQRSIFRVFLIRDGEKESNKNDGAILYTS